METAPKAPIPLALLLVEDVESDAQMLIRLLRKAGYDLAYEQVENEAQMRAALASRAWDLVISDYSLPGFNGARALRVLGESGLDIPFIVVSGTVGEQTAVAMMKAGAHDYLMKDNLTRLVPAVQRELEQAQSRRDRRQAEKALAASEARLRALVEQLPAIVYTESAGTREATYISPQVEAVTGYTPAEWLQDHGLWYKVIHPDDRQAVIEADNHTTLTREPFHAEYRLLTRDGREIWIHDEAVLVQSPSGAPLFWQGVMYDITEPKQAERNLRESEKRAGAQRAAITELVLDQVLAGDKTDLALQRIVEVLSVALDVARASVWLLAENGSELRCLSLYEADKKLHSAGAVLKAADIPSYFQAVMSENRICTEDAQTDPRTAEMAEAYLGALGVTSMLDAGIFIEGRLVGVVCSEHIGDRRKWHSDEESFASTIAAIIAQIFLNDERRRAEEAHRSAEARYRALVEQIPATTYIDQSDGSGRSSFVSPQIQSMLGISPEAWRQADAAEWSRMIHPEDSPRVLAAYWRAMETGQPFNEEYRIFRPDGRLIWVEDHAIRLGDASGNPSGMHGVMFDITERRQAEESLRASQARYRELFNSMIDGFALHEIICDANGKPVDYRFLEVNPAFERLTGLRSVDLIGKTALEVMPNTEAYWIEVYGNVALTGRPAFYENYAATLGRHFEVSAYCPRPKQFAVVLVDVTERRTAEQDVRRRVAELEMLYQSGLALSQLLNPVEIGRKILELLEEKLNWRHTRIRLYHPQDDLLELLDFNQPGLNDEEERRKTVEHYQSLIIHAGEGMSGWVVQQGIPLRCDDVTKDPRYVEAYPGIRSGLYVPMKMGERIVGVISIEDERPQAFTEADERLVATLANQAASAFENARLFAEIRQRVVELETLNRVSLVLRSASNREEMLAIILDEALFLLNTPHGSIELYNKSTESFDRVVTRGWVTELKAPPQAAREGIVGRVFTSGEIYVTREFISDPESRDEARAYLPSGWGGVCLPIRASQQTLGVMLVSVPSGRELNRDEVRLLSIFSEMTGAALQRMQLHEQTARRLEQLNALRVVDQAISSSRDMQLTLNILLTQTISQLNVDAADVFLLSAGSSALEFAAGQGFRTLPPRLIGLNDRFAGRAIMQRRMVSLSDFDSASQVSQPGKSWKDEGFLRGWCLPLIVKGEVKGVLEVYCRRMFSPDAEWLEFLETFAGQAAIAIDNTQLFENLQRANVDLSMAYEATIEGWSRALDMRDHETEGHALRVTELTLSLARVMGVGELQLADIRRGALLHDIGKMGVPDAILLKDGDLTEEEWEIMRRHPQFARDMLLPINYLKDAFDIPYCHHEKWDGTGYPQGLQGEQIPLAARIFAVVDVWDALTNDRTYRKKWEKRKALEYIRGQSGKHFDPQVVDVFLRYIGWD